MGPGLHRRSPTIHPWLTGDAENGVAPRTPRSPASGLNLALIAGLLTFSIAAVGAPAASPNPLPHPSFQLPVPWWNASWAYARRLTVTVGADPPYNGYAGYSAWVTLDTSDATRFRGDCADLRIVYWDGTGNVELDRDLYGCGTAATQVWFRLRTDIATSSSDGDYYLYYGNASAGAPPADRSRVYLWWDDFSTDPFTAGSPRYSRVKAVDIHGDAYVLPLYDAANQRVVFDTGDNFTSDIYIDNASFSNGEQDVFLQVDHFADLSYPTNATDALVARVSALNTTSTHEYLHFSHGSYPSSPGCTIDSWGAGGERNTLCGGIAPPIYWGFNVTETWAWALSDTTHRFWRDPATTFASPDPNGRTQLLTGTLSAPQAGYVGLAPAQTRGWWDNFLVRRYTEPEPVTTLGAEYAFASLVISDPKTDSLFSDNDGNGVPSPGDELAYAVFISVSGNSSASGVVFTDTPGTNTALVVGTVTTTQGTITSGNNPGDTSLTVDIGLLSPGTTIGITFRVTIDDPLPPGIDRVSNQGLVSGAEFPPAPTDDPATPASSDPTTTILGRLATELPSTGFPPGSLTALPRAQAPALQTLGDLWLEIPRLDLRAPIVGVPLGPEGWDLTWLSDQAGYLDGTAFPSRPGNSVLTGHVYLPDGSPGPFQRIGDLRWDDEIIVHAYGQRAVYHVREVRLAAPTDLSPLAHEPYPWVTLLTCAGYDPEAQRYARRLVVRAVLAQIETASSVPAPSP